MQEMQAQSLGQVDSLEKEIATHSRFLLGNLMYREAHGVAKELGMT